MKPRPTFPRPTLPARRLGRVGLDVGADLDGSLWWLPVTKDRPQAADWSGTVSPYDTAVYPGYAADLEALADVEERREGRSAMPEDLSKHLSREEMRDLIEYLSGLK